LGYFWLWFALFGSIILYIPLFLLHLGMVPTDTTGEKWYLPSADLVSIQHQARNGYGDQRQPEPQAALPSDGAEALSRADLKLWSTIL
jgi:hypothetical protein